MRRARVMAGAVVTLLLAGAGCESTEELLALAEVEHTPLALDPTEAIEFSGWWAGGGRMLRLDGAGSYAVYPGTNRYRDPVGRGAWARDGYARLWLMPYRAGPSQRLEVRVSKPDGRLALDVPGAGVMRRIDGPPAAPEDALLGAWTSEEGRLVLREDRRYAFVRAPERLATEAVTVGGHQGAWRLERDPARVVLAPDPPNLGPFELALEGSEDGDDGGTVLASGHARFHRAPADPPQPFP